MKKKFLILICVASLFPILTLATENNLATAINKNQVETVKLLLGKGAEPNSKDNGGKPIIFSALNKPKLMELLIQHGADVDVARDSDSQWTPFLWTVFDAATDEKDESFEVIKLLLKHGVDINKMVKRSTALQIAITNSRKPEKFKTVEFLLKNKADPNQAICAGQNCITPLMNAVRLKNTNVVKLLIDHGANVNFQAKSDKSSSALRLAVADNSADIIEILKKAGAR